MVSTFKLKVVCVNLKGGDSWSEDCWSYNAQFEGFPGPFTHDNENKFFLNLLWTKVVL